MPINKKCNLSLAGFFSFANELCSLEEFLLAAFLKEIGCSLGLLLCRHFLSLMHRPSRLRAACQSEFRSVCRGIYSLRWGQLEKQRIIIRDEESSFEKGERYETTFNSNCMWSV